MIAATTRTNRRKHRAAVSGGALLCALAFAAPAAALPVGPAIVAQAGATPGDPGASFGGAAGLLTVTQSAQRVVIDWRGFNIAGGETVNFVQPGATSIAFNRITALDATTINGVLSGNGGVWLFAPGGFVFGSGAQVNVGSFVAATAGLPDSALADATGSSRVDLGAGTGALTVQPGAKIDATAGGVFLQSPALTQNGAITASGGITYVASEGGRLRFTEGDAAVDLALESLPSGPASGSPRLDHGGTSTAGGGVTVQAQAPASGSRAFINLGGVVEADGQAGDGTSLVVTGGGTNPVGGPGGGVDIDARAGTLRSSGAAQFDGDNIQLGALTAGALRLRAYGDVELGAAYVFGDIDARTDAPGGVFSVSSVASGGGGVTLDSAGDLRIAAPLRAGQYADLFAAGDLSIGPTMISVDGTGGLFLTAGRDVTADAASALLSGGGEGYGEVQAIAGETTGGNLSLGAVTGSNLTLFAAGAGGRGGQVTTVGAQSANGDILIESIGDGSAGSSGGVAVSADANASGAFQAYGFGGGEVLVGPGAHVSAAAVTLSSSGNVRIAAGARADSAGALTLAAENAIVVESGGEASGVTPVPASTWPVAAYPVTGEGVSLSAARFDLAGTVSANAPGSATGPVSAGAGEIAVQLIGTAAAVGDGTSGTSVLSSASLQAFRATNLYLIGAEGQDLAVGALTLDASRIASLWVGADPAKTLSITGAVNSSGTSPTALRLGFVHTTPDGQESFLPKTLIVTGGLGVGGRLGALSMAASGDVLVGTSAFVGAAQADANFDPVARSTTYARGVTPLQLFIAARSLQVAAGGRVFQQNTGLTIGFGGMSVDAPTADTPLVVAPSSVAALASGPTRVDVFGSFINANGTVTTGAVLARYPYLTGNGAVVKPRYRINACPFGTQSACAADSATATLPDPQQLISPLLALVSQFTNSSLTDTASFVFLPKSADAEAERDAIASPAAGLSNEDLYGGAVLEPLEALDDRDRREREKLGGAPTPPAPPPPAGQTGPITRPTTAGAVANGPVKP